MAGQGSRGDSASGVTRREALGTGIALSLAGLVWPRFAFGKGKDPTYAVTGWSGDDYEVPHRFRDRRLEIAKSKPKKRFDVVVIGAGISGLAAAVRLRETNLLVLESAAEAGGNAKARSFGGGDYNIGAAYIVDREGELGVMYDEIGMKLEPVEEPVDSWYLHGKWVHHPWADETIASLPSDLGKAMAGLKAALVELNDGEDFPLTPYEGASARARAFDDITFEEWLKPFAHPDLMPFLDAYCHSALGAAPSVLSAYAGINFYADILSPIFTYPEGNARVARAMVAKIASAGAGRIETGCLVYSVKPTKSGGAVVHYVKDGRPEAVEATRVVLAAPFFMASRMIDGLASAQKQALGCQHYCSYRVANLHLDRRIVTGAYDGWTPSPAGFQDVIPSDWTLFPHAAELHGNEGTATPGEPSSPPAEPNAAPEPGGQVVALFAPYRSASLGRHLMMTESKEDHARQFVAAFEKLFPGSTQHLTEVHLTRWGHGFMINRPKMHSRWLAAIKKQIGPIHLCHSDGQAIPSIEAAIHEGAATARWVLDTWRNKSP